MKDKYCPQDFTLLDVGIRLRDALAKYPESCILMTNMRYDENDDDIGDVFFVGESEEVSKVERRLEGFYGIGSFPGEAILKRSLGLNSLR
jgi:hypothetical protein